MMDDWREALEHGFKQIEARRHGPRRRFRRSGRLAALVQEDAGHVARPIPRPLPPGSARLVRSAASQGPGQGELSPGDARLCVSAGFSDEGLGPRPVTACIHDRIRAKRPPPANARAMRSCGREAEGGGLLNRYTIKSRIEGSNPLRLRQTVVQISLSRFPSLWVLGSAPKSMRSPVH